MKRLLILGGWLGAMLACGAAPAENLHLAVASNFRPAMEVIAQRFARESPVRLVVSYGSTGKHYAQILNGAPFDAFFAADARHPALLEANGFAVRGSRFTYARGCLVLWSPRPDFVDNAGVVLGNGGFRFLAIANPELAPYGAAARQVLDALRLWEPLQERLVRGENIAQAFQFVVGGAAELGFVAASQLTTLDSADAGSSWVVPQHLYAPIEQQAVALTDTGPTHALLAFMRREEALELLRAHGYETP